ncbi:hypothetical protein [Polymorphobacter sp.]|uniref:hypothetical protein n=1 Tax=Polymorphobacter sp. TaxID=1909290 RepID=UPI003F729CB4
MKGYKVERQHVSKMGSTAWLRWAGPFLTRAEAEREVQMAINNGGRPLRIVEVEVEEDIG